MSDTKLCTKCKQEKGLFEFHKVANSPQRWRSECKECGRASSRAYAAAHADKARERVISWRKDNPERARQAALRVRRAKPEKYREASRERGKRDAEQLTDAYVRRLVAQHSGIPRSAVPDALVDAKRIQIQIIRLIKEQSA